MIHLDSNVLVALADLTHDNHPFIQRIKSREPAVASALAWFEFCCGPLTEQHLQLARAVLAGRVTEINGSIAERAAMLFNVCGRKRSLRTDCLIAATAVLADAELATFNASDFEPFTPYGLKLLAL